MVYLQERGKEERIDLEWLRILRMIAKGTVCFDSSFVLQKRVNVVFTVFRLITILIKRRFGNSGGRGVDIKRRNAFYCERSDCQGDAG